MPDPVLPTFRFGPIGLGCVTFGREIDETAAFSLMDYAREKGITLFDTAEAYANGASECIVGKWLAARHSAANPIHVATKVRPPFSPAHVQESVKRSAERLRRKTIDLLFLHKWDESAQHPAVLHALDDAVRRGRVCALGASNFTPPQLARVLELQKELGCTPIRFLQNNHNLAVRDVDDELQALCAANDIAVITYSPLGAGFLTGKHRLGVVAGSRFDLIPGHQQVYFHGFAHRRLARLESVAERTGQSMTHLALAWALHRRGTASVLVGGRTPAHLDQAFAALAFNDPGVFAELEAD